MAGYYSRSPEEGSNSMPRSRQFSNPFILRLNASPHSLSWSFSSSSLAQRGAVEKFMAARLVLSYSSLAQSLADSGFPKPREAECNQEIYGSTPHSLW